MNFDNPVICRLLPDSLNDWIISNQSDIKSHEALYDYIDGGAEQFISYGFSNAISKTYTKTGEPEVRVEIFDMGNSKDAYGIFSNIRYDETNEFGQGSQYVSGALFFWKNKYYVSISTVEETSESVKFIKEMAAYICNQIPTNGDKPQILHFLPQKSLDQNGILYFHHYIWLNAFLFISNDNILNINDSTDAVFAKYGKNDNRSFLLIVHYMDIAQLTSAYTNFVQHYFSEPVTNEVFPVEDNKWMGLRKENCDLIILFNGENEQQVKDLIRQTVENIHKYPISDENSTN